MDRQVPFGQVDWALLGVTALLWGSSFLLIEVGLTGFEPAAIAWLRVLFGAAALACLPAARRPIRRADRPWVAVLGTVWMAGPFLLLSFAQTSISSAVAGMINGAAPLWTVALASCWTRSVPAGPRLVGLLLGFGGVAAIGSGADGGTTLLGAGMVLVATVSYGFAFNLAAPLQRRNGALPVIWRAQLVALVLTAPPGLVGLAGSSPTWSGFAAMVALGALSTGVAFAAFTTLVGRVGAAGGSVAVYFVPVVALLLGALILDDSVAPIAIAGTALVVVGAYLTGRGPQPSMPVGHGVRRAAGAA